MKTETTRIILNADYAKALKIINELTAERDAALKRLGEFRQENQKLKSIIADWPACEKHWSSQPHAGKSLCPECLVNERDAALKACAEIKALANAIHDYKATGYTGIDIDLAIEVINSAECGKGYHADSEWKPVVEALRESDNHLNAVGTSGKHPTRLKNMDALAHAEKLMKQ